MSILVLTILVIIAVLVTLWFFVRFFHYQRDPRQHELADLLGQEAAYEKTLAADRSSTVALYATGQGWSEKQTARRLLHAAALVAADAPALDAQADSLAKRAIEKL